MQSHTNHYRTTIWKGFGALDFWKQVPYANYIACWDKIAIFIRLDCPLSFALDYFSCIILFKVVIFLTLIEFTKNDNDNGQQQKLHGMKISKNTGLAS